MKINFTNIGYIKPIILSSVPVGLIAGAAAITDKRDDSESDDSNILSLASKNNFIAAKNINIPNRNDFLFTKKVYVLSGSSGVGKDTLLREFLARNPEYKLLTTYTTRPMRDGEINGKDYHFISNKEFDAAVENGEFIEWAIFSGNKYGTKKKSIEDALNNNENIILKLDTTGALKVKSLMPNAVLIFVAPPSPEELERRLRERNTESKKSIKERLAAVESELLNAKQYDYTIVNDTVDNAVEKLERIILGKD